MCNLQFKLISGGNEETYNNLKKIIIFIKSKFSTHTQLGW